MAGQNTPPYFFIQIIMLKLMGNSMEYTSGSIFYANLYGAMGSEQEGKRPVVIIQNNIGNRYSPTVIVVPITSKVNLKANIPTHVFVPK